MIKVLLVVIFLEKQNLKLDIPGCFKIG